MKWLLGQAETELYIDGVYPGAEVCSDNGVYPGAELYCDDGVYPGVQLYSDDGVYPAAGAEVYSNDGVYLKLCCSEQVCII